jgi:hypothetical protein
MKRTRSCDAFRDTRMRHRPEKRKSGTLVTRYLSFPHKRCATNSKACPTRHLK